MPHKNLIYSICIKYTYNQEDIEDNYLEALANFFKYMDSYDPARPVKTWIYAVTKRLVADLNNRNRNRMPPDDNIDISEISSSLSDEEDVYKRQMSIPSTSCFWSWRNPLRGTSPKRCMSLSPALPMPDIALIPSRLTAAWPSKPQKRTGTTNWRKRLPGARSEAV